MLDEMDDALEPTDRSGKSSSGGEDDIVVDTDAVLLVNAGVDCVADNFIGGVNSVDVVDGCCDDDDDDALLLSDNTTGGNVTHGKLSIPRKEETPLKEEEEWPNTHTHTHNPIMNLPAVARCS